MQSFPTDAARLQPSSDSLNIILKNTHFSDDILSDSQKVKLYIDYRYPLAVAVLSFAAPFYDFILPLRLSSTNAATSSWLNQTCLAIKLVLADPVITDRLSTLTFRLDSVESEKLRVHIKAQENLSPVKLNEIENQIYADANSFFVRH